MLKQLKEKRKFLLQVDINPTKEYGRFLSLREDLFVQLHGKVHRQQRQLVPVPMKGRDQGVVPHARPAVIAARARSQEGDFHAERGRGVI